MQKKLKLKEGVPKTVNTTLTINRDLYDSMAHISEALEIPIQIVLAEAMELRIKQFNKELKTR